MLCKVSPRRLSLREAPRAFFVRQGRGLFRKCIFGYTIVEKLGEMGYNFDNEELGEIRGEV